VFESFCIISENAGIPRGMAFPGLSAHGKGATDAKSTESTRRALVLLVIEIIDEVRECNFFATKCVAIVRE
jgi:hypothetical protein